MIGKVKNTDTFLEGFGKLVNIDSKKCVRFISNNKVLCDTCIKKCPSQAISIDKKSIAINWDSCLECGVCVKECKMGVFSLKYYKDNKVYNEIASLSKSGEPVVLSCKKVSSKNRIGVTIPCGGWIDDSTFIWAIANGAKEVYIKLSDCKSCDIVCGFEKLTEEVENFKTFQKALKLDCKIQIIDETAKIKLNLDKANKKEDVNLSRRELFSYFKRRSKTSIGQIYGYMSNSDKQEVSNRSVVLNEEKKLPFRKNIFVSSLVFFDFKDIKNNLPQKYVFKYLGGVLIDQDKCNLCGICYRLCPTGALMEISKENDEGYLQKEGIKTNNMHCLNCDVCISWCDKDAIQYTAILEE